MAKSKYAPALFEVIHSRQDAKTGGGKLSVPKWWKSRENQAAQTVAEPPPPPDAVPEPAEAPQTEEPARDPVVVSAPAPVSPAIVAVPVRTESVPATTVVVTDLIDPPPLVQLQGGRLALSLNPVTAAVVGGVVLIALFTFYQLGKSWGYAAGAKQTAVKGDDELESALNQTPHHEVLRPVPSQSRGKASARENASARAAVTAVQPATPRETPASPAVRSTGSVHVVLDTFKAGHLASAEFAKKWLQTKGYATKIEKRGETYRLSSVDGFEDEAKAKQYMETVRQLGQELNREMRNKKVPNYDLHSPMTVKEK